MWLSRDIVILVLCIPITSADTGSCCSCGTTSITEDNVFVFNEGQSVTLNVIGDKNGDGCKFVFQIQEKDQNITCCYIHKDRTERERVRLCGSGTQPKACKKEEEYEVKEIDGPIGECTLTLFDGKQSDSGDYEIVFPRDTRYNTTRKVSVIKNGLYLWEWLLITFSILFLLVITLILIILSIPKLEDRDQHNRRHDEEILKLLMEHRLEELKKRLDWKDKLNLSDEEIFKHLQDKKVEALKKMLGSRNILGLRDRNYNNLFHLAAGADWKEEMTQIVFKIRHESKENQETESLKMKMIFNLISKNKISVNIPDYIVPNCLLHWTINLNTRNSEGNTPLIIASKENKVDVVKVLVKKKVQINLQNHDGHTALHQAVDKKNDKIVSLLIYQKAKPESALQNGQTVLHTAIERNAMEIVELLVTYMDRTKDHTSPISFLRERWTGNIAMFEKPPLHVAVTLGYSNISKYLIEKGYEDWHNGEKERTVFKLVAAGNTETLKLLIEKSILDWSKFQQFCLLEAIDDANNQAVNNIYSLTDVPKPSEQDRKLGLKKANVKLLSMQEEQKKNKTFIEHLENEETIQIDENKKITLKKAYEKLSENIGKVKDISERLEKEGDISIEEPED